MWQKIAWLTIFLLNLFLVKAQNDSLVYKKSREYIDGIYLSINDFVNNKPSLNKTNIISDIDKSASDYYNKVSSKYKIRYQDGGKNNTILSENVFGMCEGGKVFIMFEKEYYSFTNIGALSCFKGFVSSFSEVGNRTGTGAGLNGSILTGENMDCFVDMKTQSIEILNVDNLENIFRRDNALYGEFIKLSRKERKDSLFVFVEKYNNKYTVIDE